MQVVLSLQNMKEKYFYYILDNITRICYKNILYLQYKNIFFKYIRKMFFKLLKML
jgi:hypothetical protein